MLCVQKLPLHIYPASLLRVHNNTGQGPDKMGALQLTLAECYSSSHTLMLTGMLQVTRVRVAAEVRCRADLYVMSS